MNARGLWPAIVLAAVLLYLFACSPVDGATTAPTPTWYWHSPTPTPTATATPPEKPTFTCCVAIATPTRLATPRATP